MSARAVTDRTYIDTSHPIHTNSDRTADVGALCERMSFDSPKYAVIDRTYISGSRHSERRLSALRPTAEQEWTDPGPVLLPRRS